MTQSSVLLSLQFSWYSSKIRRREKLAYSSMILRKFGPLKIFYSNIVCHSLLGQTLNWQRNSKENASSINSTVRWLLWKSIVILSPESPQLTHKVFAFLLIVVLPFLTSARHPHYINQETISSYHSWEQDFIRKLHINNTRYILQRNLFFWNGLDQNFWPKIQNIF